MRITWRVKFWWLMVGWQRDGSSLVGDDVGVTAWWVKSCWRWRWGDRVTGQVLLEMMVGWQRDGLSLVGDDVGVTEWWVKSCWRWRWGDRVTGQVLLEMMFVSSVITWLWLMVAFLHVNNYYYYYYRCCGWWSELAHYSLLQLLWLIIHTCPTVQWSKDTVRMAIASITCWNSTPIAAIIM